MNPKGSYRTFKSFYRPNNAGSTAISPEPTRNKRMFAPNRTKSYSQPIFSSVKNGTFHSKCFLYAAPAMMIARPSAASCVRKPKINARPPSISQTPMKPMKELMFASFPRAWTMKMMPMHKRRSSRPQSLYACSEVRKSTIEEWGKKYDSA